MSGSSIVRAALGGAIDYAGLFPPAALGMGAAVQNYARYRGGEHAWLLGRFVLGVARLEEFAAAYAALAPGAATGTPPWRLSVIARAADAPALAAFNARYGVRTTIDSVEVPPSSAAEIADAAALGALYTTYVEVPLAGDVEAIVAALGAHKLRAKVRTGGVTPDAIPAAEAVARFIAACTQHGVPWKATAGLHHAWRGEYALTYEDAAPRGTMHGFINVLGAALAARRAAPQVADTIVRTLQAQPTDFTITDQAVRVNGTTFDATAGAAMRTSGFQSFGSCSFEEPVADLIALRVA
ncbi:MAG: hypothetical protein FJ202_08350 [Gemmatimonadetes bacterium]|nr:hypothetical protein [Gemmatimonadota bacterium]